MKKIVLIPLISFAMLACQVSENIEPNFYDCKFNFADSSAKNPQRIKYQALIDGITAKGAVGITMSVHKPQSGMWIGASGKADLHNNIAMKPCNISRVGSTVKIFTAVAVLQLVDAGKIRLDDKISKYLPENILKNIENTDKATIRQLLNHSSGIHNYIQNLQFQTASLNDLIREWHSEDLLKYSHHQKAYFQPDEDVRYSNSGYILLGLLIEKIEGKPFYKVFEEKIFKPLNLRMTQFAAENPVPNGIVRGYTDFYSNLQVIESTYFSGWDYFTADGGLISNSYDMSVFFQALMNGKLLKNNTLNEMLTWKTPKETDVEFFPISYGMGIFKIETTRGIAYLHSGDAIGYYANLLYFPSDKTTIFYTVNSNYGKIDQFISSKDAMEKIINEIK